MRGAIGEYRRAIRRFAGMPALAVWYSRLDEQSLTAALREEMGAEHARRLDGRAAKARSKDSNRAFAKLAYHINGDARIVSEPPLITPIEELVPAARVEEINEMMTELLARYRATLRTELRRLLDRYRFVHVARKVVGVGSVGTRAWVLLLLGREHSDPLFLQAKEAGPSALEAYAGPCKLDNQGQRVVEGQVLTQAASDIFLGWLRAEGIDGQTRDFYVRQLWDWKVSADLEHMEPKVLGVYARLCGWTLARAHARAGDAAAIGGYLGSGDVFDRALAGFAELYADQNEHDYGLFVAAIRSGRIAAHHL